MEVETCSTIQRLRKPKILNMSIFDWVTSLLAAFLIGFYGFHLKGVKNWAIFIAAWIVFGILTHWVFGVNTMLGYYLGINPIPQRKECV